MKKTTLMILAGLLIASPMVLSFDSEASGFNRLKAAGSGLDKEGDSEKGSQGEEGSEGEEGSIGAAPSPERALMDTAEVILIGQYQTYLPDKRINARLSVFGRPSDFKYADWACKQYIRVRDGVLTYLYENPPKSDSRGQVETAGLNEPMKEVIHKALRTKYNPFNEIYVINGRYSERNPPKELEEFQVAGCKDVEQIAKDLKNMKK